MHKGRCRSWNAQGQWQELECGRAGQGKRCRKSIGQVQVAVNRHVHPLLPACKAGTRSCGCIAELASAGIITESTQLLPHPEAARLAEEPLAAAAGEAAAAAAAAAGGGVQGAGGASPGEAAAGGSCCMEEETESLQAQYLRWARLLLGMLCIYGGIEAQCHDVVASHSWPGPPAQAAFRCQSLHPTPPIPSFSPSPHAAPADRRWRGQQTVSAGARCASCPSWRMPPTTSPAAIAAACST